MEVVSKSMGAQIHEMEGYDEVVQKLVEKLPPERRVAGLSPEQVLAAYKPEERVAGLSPEQILLTLPDDALRALSDAYLATLSEPTRAAIRRRTGR